MRCILLITDEMRRAERLSRDLGMVGRWVLHDLFNDAAPPLERPDVVVSDISSMTSDAILRLRRILDQARGGAPYVSLLHENTARATLQAEALGASRTLPAATASRMLASAVGGPEGEAQPAAEPGIRHRAARARTFITGMFVPGRPITPELIDDGTEIVDQAVSEAGIRDWLEIVWRFDDATHQHCLLVAGLAAAFARALGLGPRDCRQLTRAALLHDVGKTRIPIQILNKRGRLDESEMQVVRTHPLIGYEMLIGHGFDDLMLAVVRSHHEYLDGTGYPDGLQGREIPDLVRLVTICDIYAALIERRPYRAPMSMTRAYAILVEMGPKLDVDLVRAFLPITTAFDDAGAMAVSA